MGSAPGKFFRQADGLVDPLLERLSTRRTEVRVGCAFRRCPEGEWRAHDQAPPWLHSAARSRKGHGTTGSRRALRARADSRRGRRGRPVLQGPVLAAADGERRNCRGVRGVLSEVPEAFMSDA